MGVFENATQRVLTHWTRHRVGVSGLTGFVPGPLPFQRWIVERSVVPACRYSRELRICAMTSQRSVAVPPHHAFDLYSIGDGSPK